MAEDAINIVRTKLKYKDREKGIGRRTEKEAEGIFIEADVSVESDLANKKDRAYFNDFERTGNKGALYFYLDKLVNDFEGKAKNREPVIDEEIELIEKQFGWLPGGGEITKEQMSKQVKEVAEWIYENNYSDPDQALVAASAWSGLRLKTIKDNGDLPQSFGQQVIDRIDRIWKGIIGKNRDSQPRIVDIYDFCNAHEGNAHTLRLSDLLMDKLVREGKEDLLRQMVASESQFEQTYLTTPALREKYQTILKEEADEKLAINPLEYWDKRLLKATEKRLSASRGEAVARVSKNKKKIEITEPKKNKLASITSSLSYRDLSANTHLGKLLARHGRRDYWEGKARLDFAYWYLFKGVRINNKGEREIDEGGDLFSRIMAEKLLLDSRVRDYLGHEAQKQFALDDEMMDCLSELWLTSDRPYEEILNELATNDQLMAKLKRKYGPDYQLEVSGELPREITDAAMLAYIYAMDVEANGSKDRRYTIFKLPDYYRKRFVFYPQSGTRRGGSEIKQIPLLGEGYQFMPDDLERMGWVAPRNMYLNYGAISGDQRAFEPSKPGREYQRTANWQSHFFFLMGLRNNPGTRREVPDSDVPGDSIDVGSLGEYMVFDNKRSRHRKALYKWFRELRDWDMTELAAGGKGVAGFNADIRNNLDEMLVYFAQSQEINFDQTTNGMNDSQWANLNMVLNDHRSWGLVMDFRDKRVVDWTGAGNDLMYSWEYVEKGEKAKSILLKALASPPGTTLEEIPLDPAKILGLVKEMGHRVQQVFFYRNIYTLLKTFERSAVINALQSLINQRGKIDELTSRHGSGLFWWEKGILETNPNTHLFGLGEELEFFENSPEEYSDFFVNYTLAEVFAIESGMVDNFNNTISYLKETMVNQLAFDWQTKRKLTVEERAFINNHMAGWLDRGQPVPANKMVSVVRTNVVENGRPIYAQRELVMQNMTKIEIDGRRDSSGNLIMETDEFGRPTTIPLAEGLLEPLPLEEAGELFGGYRQAGIRRVGVVLRELNSDRSLPIKDVSGRNVAASRHQRVFISGTRGSWAKVIIDGIEGWVKQSEINILDNMETNGGQRPGEIPHEGGRLVWKRALGWQWVEGKWKVNKLYNRQEFVEGEGYDRVFSGTWDNWFDNNLVNTLNDENVEKPMQKKLAQYPFMAFKSTKHWSEYLLHRNLDIFLLITGRSEGATAGGEAILKLSKWYEADKASLDQLVPQIGMLAHDVGFTNAKLALLNMEKVVHPAKFRFGWLAETMEKAYSAAAEKEINLDLSSSQKIKLIDVAKRRFFENLDQVLDFKEKVAIWGSSFRVKFGIPISPAGLFTAATLLTAANTILQPMVGAGLQEISALIVQSTIDFFNGAGLSLISTPIGYFAGIAGWAITAGGLYFTGLSIWDRWIAGGAIEKLHKHPMKPIDKDFDELRELSEVDKPFPVL